MGTGWSSSTAGAPSSATVSLSLIHILHRIRSLKSRTGGRIEASLENGERLVVSRHYAPLLRERLGL